MQTVVMVQVAGTTYRIVSARHCRLSRGQYKAFRVGRLALG